MLNRIAVIIFLLFSSHLFSSDIELVSWINEYREEHGISRLYIEEILVKTAGKYAAVLLEENRISHTGRSGRRVLDRYRDEGGTAYEAGEILGTGKNTFEIFQAWIGSESHNQLMLKDKWLRIGTALVEKEGIYVAVVLFSTSSIDMYSISSDENTLKLTVKPINNEMSLNFSSKLIRDLNLNNKIEPDSYYLTFTGEELPLLIIVLNGIDRVIKKTDILYIGDMKKVETH